MSMTAVPISILLVRAPTAARSGNGEPSWRAKWCTRKYAPSAPNSSAATASSIDCSSESAAVCTCEWGDGVQCPNDRNPIFFTCTSYQRAVKVLLGCDTAGVEGYSTAKNAARRSVALTHEPASRFPLL